jgi:pyruvate dehydrogenase E2 component (dihydrolipoamide acetyltransferase)
MIVALGQVTDEAVVEDGQVIAGKLLRISATFDHRVLDGAHAAVLVKAVREFFADPERYDPPLSEVG